MSRLFVFLTTLLLPSLTSAVVAGTSLKCNADNCARAVTGTSFPGHDQRIAACSSFFQQCSITPGSGGSPAVTNCPTSVPSYASACSGTSRYSSACACAGVTRAQSSSQTPTIPVTTAITSASTSEPSSAVTCPVATSTVTVTETTVGGTVTVTPSIATPPASTQTVTSTSTTTTTETSTVGSISTTTETSISTATETETSTVTESEPCTTSTSDTSTSASDTMTATTTTETTTASPPPSAPTSDFYLNVVGGPDDGQPVTGQYVYKDDFDYIMAISPSRTGPAWQLSNVGVLTVINRFTAIQSTNTVAGVIGINSEEDLDGRTPIRCEFVPSIDSPGELDLTCVGSPATNIVFSSCPYYSGPYPDVARVDYLYLSDSVPNDCSLVQLKVTAVPEDGGD